MISPSLLSHISPFSRLDYGCVWGGRRYPAQQKKMGFRTFGRARRELGMSRKRKNPPPVLELRGVIPKLSQMHPTANNSEPCIPVLCSWVGPFIWTALEIINGRKWSHFFLAYFVCERERERGRPTTSKNVPLTTATEYRLLAEKN